MSWILTTAVMAGIVGLLFVVGLCVARCLAWRRQWTADDWLDAPFLGMAAIVIVLQNAIYAGFPLRITSWPFLVLVAAVLVVAAWRGRLIGVWAVCPKPALALAFGVLVIHGIGLWIVGIRAYTGRAWGDQINYDIIAQYLVDFVYGSPAAADQPVALIGSFRAQSRIGQSTLQGFLSVLFPLGPKALFEPTILLSPLLVSVALVAYGVRARLPRRLTFSLAALGALLPAVASVHLESFLSHALALPCLLYVPIMLDRAAERRSWGDYLRAGLVIASTTAIYLEMFLVLEACVLLFFVAACFDVDGRRRNLPALVVVGLLPLVFGTTRGLAQVLGYIGRPVLGQLYPWALSLEGVQRLWAGDLVGEWWPASAPIARALAVGLVAAGYLGLLRQVGVETTGVPGKSSMPVHGMARSVCALGLALLPLGVLVRDDEHPYQFYKLLLTMAPLLAWGAGYALWSLPIWFRQRTRESLAVACAIALSLVAASGTLAMARTSVDRKVHPRQNTVITLDPGFLAVEQRLRQTAGRDIISCVSDAGPPDIYANGWLALFAHRNRTWVLNPMVNDNLLPNLVSPDYFQQIPGLLQDPIILTSTLRGAVWARLPNSPQRVDFGSYSLAMPRHEPVAFICSATLVAGTDGAGRLVVPPGGVELTIYSNLQGPATVVLQTSPDDPAYMGMGARMNGEREYKAVSSNAAGVVTVPVHLTPGVTRISVVAPFRRDGATVLADPVALSLAEFELPTSVVKNPNGLETVDGRPFFWLGGGPTTIAVFSPAAGTCVLTLDTTPGPSVGRAVRRLRVTSGTAFTVDISTQGGDLTVEVPVSEGWTPVDIQPLDSPDMKTTRDPRPLIVGVRQVTARLRLPQNQ